MWSQRLLLVVAATCSAYPRSVPGLFSVEETERIVALFDGSEPSRMCGTTSRCAARTAGSAARPAAGAFDWVMAKILAADDSWGGALGRRVVVPRGARRIVLLHEFAAADGFGWHVDATPNDVLDDKHRFLNVNVVLSDPGDYDGGALQVGATNVSLGRGDLHVYRASTRIARGAVATSQRARPSAITAFDGFSRARYDLARFLTILLVNYVLKQVPLSRAYHWIRGQNTIKLYVIVGIMEVFDRLLCAFSQDALDSFYLTTRHATEWRRVLLFFGLVNVVVVSHSLLLYTHLTTLNVVVNASEDSALVALLVSNNFSEIKSAVFKKYNATNLFDIACSDVCERFKLLLFLCLLTLLSWSQVAGDAEERSSGLRVVAAQSAVLKLLSSICLAGLACGYGDAAAQPAAPRPNRARPSNSFDAEGLPGSPKPRPGTPPAAPPGAADAAGPAAQAARVDAAPRKATFAEPRRRPRARKRGSGGNGGVPWLGTGS
ncbi:hypothetical protein JL720_16587 [Aureococcus anophagefferens]|nr:hypothetical protein JL720_16587 [Aureococcus anophagefferens]